MWKTRSNFTGSLRAKSKYALSIILFILLSLNQVAWSDPLPQTGTPKPPFGVEQPNTPPAADPPPSDNPDETNPSDTQKEPAPDDDGENEPVGDGADVPMPEDANTPEADATPGTPAPGADDANKPADHTDTGNKPVGSETPGTGTPPTGTQERQPAPEGGGVTPRIKTDPPAPAPPETPRLWPGYTSLLYDLNHDSPREELKEDAEDISNWVNSFKATDKNNLALGATRLAQQLRINPHQLHKLDDCERYTDEGIELSEPGDEDHEENNKNYYWQCLLGKLNLHQPKHKDHAEALRLAMKSWYDYHGKPACLKDDDKIEWKKEKDKEKMKADNFQLTPAELDDEPGAGGRSTTPEDGGETPPFPAPPRDRGEKLRCDIPEGTHSPGPGTPGNQNPTTEPETEDETLTDTYIETDIETDPEEEEEEELPEEEHGGGGPEGGGSGGGGPESGGGGSPPSIEAGGEGGGEEPLEIPEMMEPEPFAMMPLPPMMQEGLPEWLLAMMFGDEKDDGWERRQAMLNDILKARANLNKTAIDKLLAFGMQLQSVLRVRPRGKRTGLRNADAIANRNPRYDRRNPQNRFQRPRSGSLAGKVSQLPGQRQPGSGLASRTGGGLQGGTSSSSSTTTSSGGRIPLGPATAVTSSSSSTSSSSTATTQSRKMLKPKRMGRSLK